MKIIWTSKAKNSFSLILNYLNKEWTEKEKIKFVSETTKILSLINQNPYMFIASTKNNTIRKAFINKHISLSYRIKKSKNTLELLLFWSNLQNPKKLDY